MRKNWVPAFVLVAALLGIAGAFAYFLRSQTTRYTAARGVVDARSKIVLELALEHSAGPLVRESYRMTDDEGTSALVYRVLGRGGLQITVSEVPRVTLASDGNVAFLFDEVVHDGIWRLRSKPPRGDTSVSYTVSIAQVAGDAHGSYRFTFTDPHYWATTGGRQFILKLHKGAPLPNLLQMSSTTLVDPRYAELIADFEHFGSNGFRAKSAAARARAARAVHA